MSENDSLIARQPICNKQLKVVAYELLYRMRTTDNAAVINNADGATIDVILSAFNDLSIQDVIGNKRAFINFTSNILLKELPPISPKQLVIELLENQEITPELLKVLTRLRKSGYKIALDDFCLNAETISLIDYSDIIKLDVLEFPPEKWEPYIPRLKAKGIVLLAEKVEDHDVYERCVKLGFDLFQGYFFAKPKIISGRRLSNNEISILNLISKLNKSDVDIDEINQIISSDANLTYSILRTINSGLYALPSKVESIRHAITLLGIVKLRNMANFFALSSLDSKPKVLAEMAMVRAKTCELVGKKITGRQGDDFFTVGLLSMIDAFLDVPLSKLVERLPLSDAIKSALINQTGDMGQALISITEYQTGEWSDSLGFVTENGKTISEEDIAESYIEALKWAEEALGSSA